MSVALEADSRECRDPESKGISEGRQEAAKLLEHPESDSL